MNNTKILNNKGVILETIEINNDPLPDVCILVDSQVFDNVAQIAIKVIILFAISIGIGLLGPMKSVPMFSRQFVKISNFTTSDSNTNKTIFLFLEDIPRYISKINLSIRCQNASQVGSKVVHVKANSIFFSKSNLKRSKGESLSSEFFVDEFTTDSKLIHICCIENNIKKNFYNSLMIELTFDVFNAQQLEYVFVESVMWATAFEIISKIGYTIVLSITLYFFLKGANQIPGYMSLESKFSIALCILGISWNDIFYIGNYFFSSRLFVIFDKFYKETFYSFVMFMTISLFIIIFDSKSVFNFAIPFVYSLSVYLFRIMTADAITYPILGYLIILISYISFSSMKMDEKYKTRFYRYVVTLFTFLLLRLIILVLNNSYPSSFGEMIISQVAQEAVVNCFVVAFVLIHLNENIISNEGYRAPGVGDDEENPFEIFDENNEQVIENNNFGTLNLI